MDAVIGVRVGEMKKKPERHVWRTPGEAVEQQPETMGDALIIRPDNDSPRKLLFTQILHQGGVGHVVGTFYAKTALEAAERLCPDLILPEVVLVGDSVMDLLRWLKTHPDLYDVPVIVMSSKGNREIVTQAIELGAADFFILPISPQEICEVVTKVLADSARPSPSHEKLRKLRAKARENPEYSPFLQFVATKNSFFEPGYMVAYSRSGTTALGLARRALPDVIVVGHDLEDMTGLDMLDQLMADPLVSDIPVVLWSDDQSAKSYSMAGGTFAVYEGPICDKSTNYKIDRAFLEIIGSALGRELYR
jgi:CheY-like chemotaxis protein